MFYELKLEIAMLKQLHYYVNHYQLFCASEQIRWLNYFVVFYYS